MHKQPSELERLEVVVFHLQWKPEGEPQNETAPSTERTPLDSHSDRHVCADFRSGGNALPVAGADRSADQPV